MLDLQALIDEFFHQYLPKDDDLELYNEAMLQHELGFYLRSRLPDYKVQLERNIKSLVGHADTIKKEIDICLLSADLSEKYAIELKFTPNGEAPEKMYACVKDIRFMEELKALGFVSTACLCVATDPKFYTSGRIKSGIYRFFRERYVLTGTIDKPTGAVKEQITVMGQYRIEWRKFDCSAASPRRYFAIII